MPNVFGKLQWCGPRLPTKGRRMIGMLGWATGFALAAYWCDHALWYVDRADGFLFVSLGKLEFQFESRPPHA